MTKDQAVSAAQQLMDNAVARSELSGINLLIQKGGSDLLYLESGYASLADKKPWKRDTVMRLYSMSKPITGAAVMLLFERGLIDLGEAVSAYLPGIPAPTIIKDGKQVPAERPVLLHDLLSMTSGLSYGSDSVAGELTGAVIEEAKSRLDGKNPMTTQEFAVRICSNPLEFSPGERFMYGTSADVLGAVVEAVSGKSFGEFLQDEFFTPLEMPDTGFSVPGSAQDRLANVYRRTPDKGLELYTDCHLAISNRMDRPPAFESGGAGLVSTLDDYAHFAQMLHDGGVYKGRRILSEKTIRFFTRASLQPWQQKELADHWPGLSGYSYGNLMRVMTDPSRAVMFSTPGEYGWDGWLGAFFSNHPDCGLTFLVGMQLVDAGTTPLTRKLRNLLLPVFAEWEDREAIFPVRFRTPAELSSEKCEVKRSISSV